MMFHSLQLLRVQEQRPTYQKRLAKNLSVGSAGNIFSNDLWVQCDRKACLKWRKLPAGITADDVDPDAEWFCEMVCCLCSCCSWCSCGCSFCACSSCCACCCSSWCSCWCSCRCSAAPSLLLLCWFLATPISTPAHADHAPRHQRDDATLPNLPTCHLFGAGWRRARLVGCVGRAVPDRQQVRN